MCLEAGFRTKADGRRYGPFYRVVTQQEGVRRRSYIPRGFAPILMLLAENRRREQAAARAERRQLRSRLGGRRPGRRPAIPELGQRLLAASGYRCYGRRIVQDLRAWRDPAMMATRFNLLGPGWRRLVGSPEQLATLTRGAWSRLRRANRRGVTGVTFDRAFVEALAEYHDAESGGRWHGH